MVVAKHTAGDCPAGPARRDMDFVAKVAEHMKPLGVSEVYSDALGHSFYLVVDTNDTAALNTALEPFRLIGQVEVHPVLKLSEAAAWAKKMGIQR